MKLLPVREAFKPTFSYTEAKVVWALRAALAGLAAFALAVPDPQFTTRPLLFFSAVSGLGASVLFAFVPTDRPRTLSAAEAATLSAIMMHVAGHAFGLYAAFAWYDTALHFVVPLVTVLILYALSQATDWIWNWRRVTPLEVGIYLFSMTVTISTIWEVMEFGMDQLAGTKEQDNLFDTMIDVIADLGGALVGAAIAAWATRYGREHGHDQVSEDPDPTVRGGPDAAT